MKTYEDIRLCIVDNCQECACLFYCTMDMPHRALPCYLATAMALDMLYQL